MPLPTAHAEEQVSERALQREADAPGAHSGSAGGLPSRSRPRGRLPKPAGGEPKRAPSAPERGASAGPAGPALATGSPSRRTHRQGRPGLLRLHAGVAMRGGSPATGRDRTPRSTRAPGAHRAQPCWCPSPAVRRPRVGSAPAREGGPRRSCASRVFPAQPPQAAALPLSGLTRPAAVAKR